MNILQIGVNDAVDELFDMLKVNKDKITKAVFVDASLEALQVAEERYKSVGIKGEFFNYLITDTEDEFMDLYMPNGNKISGHCSVYKHFLELSQHPDIIKRSVPCKHINYFISMFKKIDYISIDVEGLDAVTVSSIDFNLANIKSLRFESAHSDGHFTKGKNFAKACDYLVNEGYTLQTIGLDTYATK